MQRSFVFKVVLAGVNMGNAGMVAFTFLNMLLASMPHRFYWMEPNVAVLCGEVVASAMIFVFDIVFLVKYFWSNCK